VRLRRLPQRVGLIDHDLHCTALHHREQIVSCAE
jgi:hypothetical protein